jgi:hypothetical protein
MKPRSQSLRTAVHAIACSIAAAVLRGSTQDIGVASW